MPGACPAEAEEGSAGLCKEVCNCPAAVHVIAMRAPGAKDIVGPVATFPEYRIVFRADRFGGALERCGIGFPPGEDIAGPETAIAERPGAAFAALDGRVVGPISVALEGFSMM